MKDTTVAAVQSSMPEQQQLQEVLLCPMPGNSNQLVSNEHSESGSVFTQIAKLIELENTLRDSKKRAEEQVIKARNEGYREGINQAIAEVQSKKVALDLAELRFVPKLLKQITPVIEKIVCRVCQEVLAEELLKNKQHIISRISRLCRTVSLFTEAQIVMCSTTTDEQLSELVSELNNHFPVNWTSSKDNSLGTGVIKIVFNNGQYELCPEVHLTQLLEELSKPPSVFDQFYRNVVFQELCEMTQ